MTKREYKLIEELAFWVEGALKCKSWNWDDDQRQAAEYALANANGTLIASKWSKK